jgi:DNA polymerase (family 10)
MSPRTVQAQHREIDTLNRELAPFHVFKGVECDILPDGSLDYDEPILASFDFVIASIHTRPNQPRDETMKRLLTAVRNPYTTIIGHPTGRLLLTHQGLDVDPDELLAAAAAAGTALELNANPYRLDLDWRCLRRARELGVPIPICPDAHTRDGLADVEFGLSMARKGGLTAADVLTCWETDAVAAYLRRKRR